MPRSRPIPPPPAGWVADAACRNNPEPEIFFPHEARTRSEIHQQRKIIAEARETCRTCPVLNQCRDYALAHPVLQGIWGGLTDSERSTYRRRSYPVSSRASRDQLGA